MPARRHWAAPPLRVDSTKIPMPSNRKAPDGVTLPSTLASAKQRSTLHSTSSEALLAKVEGGHALAAAELQRLAELKRWAIAQPKAAAQMREVMREETNPDVLLKRVQGGHALAAAELKRLTELSHVPSSQMEVADYCARRSSELRAELDTLTSSYPNLDWRLAFADTDDGAAAVKELEVPPSPTLLSAKKLKRVMRAQDPVPEEVPSAALPTQMHAAMPQHPRKPAPLPGTRPCGYRITECRSTPSWSFGQSGDRFSFNTPLVPGPGTCAPRRAHAPPGACHRAPPHDPAARRCADETSKY
jgi:hypothetical protein